MKGEQEALKLATDSGGASGTASPNSSSGWWWRNKRRPAQPAGESEADDEPALSEQLRPCKSKTKTETKGEAKRASNNGTAAGAHGEAAGELLSSNNNSQHKHREGTKKPEQQQQSSYSKIFSQYLPAPLKAASSNRKHNQQSSKTQPTFSSSSSSFQVVSAFNRSSDRQGYLSSSSSGTQISRDQHRTDQLTLQAQHRTETETRTKRKGFLYLKSPREATFGIVQRSGNKLVTKIRDLNNNTSGGSTNYGGNGQNSNSGNYEKTRDEHKVRLIEDSESDSDPSQQDHPVQQQRQQSSSKMDRRTKRPEHQLNRKADGPLLASAFLAATTLVLVCFASVAIRSALALQSPQAVAPPFAGARSQQQQQPTNGLGGGANGNEAAPSTRPLPQPAAGSLVANVNCNKIRGHVTLTPNLQGGTSVSAQILAGPPGEFYQWSVHQFPVKPGAAMCSCSALILGSKLIDLSQLHGNLPSEQEQNVQSAINLFGPESPVGHSLMLRGLKTGVVACATFLPTSRKSNYRAKFHAPLSGSVTIFQTAFGTSFTSHLMYSNGTRRHSVHQFDLVKSDDDIITTPLQPLLAPSGGRATSAADQSFEQLAQREHENELNQCRRLLRGDPSGEALLRNSSYQLSVSTENFGMRGRTSLVLPQIPFETFSSVYVVIYSEHNSNEPIACAPLRFVKPKQAAAKFQSVSVQGSVTFVQDSPYDVTLARINLNLPNSDGHSYGIDELPMIIRRKSDTRVCPNIREIIYNPHHVEPSSVPPEGEATSDQYAVGDLSGKYGSLTGKSSEKIQVNDYNLPLFGATSIIGRAMTIYSADGVAIACSNIELTTPMTTAFATFDFGIQGQFIFRQPANDCNGDTYVYIEVSKPVVSGATSSAHHQHDHNSRSLDHNWHIHVNPVDSGLDHLSSTDCSPAGGHYNPYNISTAGIYSRDCTPFNVLRCELGDLSAKMFTIDIPPYRVKGGQEPDIGKFFGTDIDLPLCGPVSVVNRSVVVHVQDFGMQRLACSTVIEFKPRSNN